MAEEYVVVWDKMDDGEVSLNSQVRNAATPRKCKALEPGGNDRQQARLPGNRAFAPPPAKCFFEFTRLRSKGGRSSQKRATLNSITHTWCKITAEILLPVRDDGKSEW